MPVDVPAVAEVPTQSAGAPNARRRRLLVGAAGVLPSIYTLASGAQVAALSQVTCFDRPPPPNPTRFTPGSDSWFRSTVYGGDYQGLPAYCVTSPQNSCIDALQPTQAAVGSAWIPQVQGVSSGLGGPPAYATRIVVLEGGGNQVTNVGKLPSAQGLIYIDKNATVLTLDPNGRQYLHAVVASCAASMIAGRPVQLG